MRPLQRFLGGACLVLSWAAQAQAPAPGIAESSQVARAEVAPRDYAALDLPHRKQVLDTIKLLDGRPPAPLPALVELALSITKQDAALQASLKGLQADLAKLAPLAKADPVGWQMLNTMRDDGVARYIVLMVKGASRGDPAAQAALDRFSKSALETPLGRQALVVREHWWDIFGPCMHRPDMPCRRANRALEGDSLDEAIESLKDEAHWDDRAIRFAHNMIIPIVLAGGAIDQAMGGDSSGNSTPSQTDSQGLCSKVVRIEVWTGVFGTPVVDMHTEMVPC